MKNGMDQRGAGLKMKGPPGKASSNEKKKDGKNSSLTLQYIFVVVLLISGDGPNITSRGPLSSYRLL